MKETDPVVLTVPRPAVEPTSPLPTLSEFEDVAGLADGVS